MKRVRCFSNAGFTMVEMSIALGMLGILSVFLVQIMKMSSQTESRMTQGALLATLDATIRISLENPDLCKNAFRVDATNNASFNPGSNASFEQSIDNFTSLNDRVIFKVGTNQTVIGIPVTEAKLSSVGGVHTPYVKATIAEVQYYKHLVRLNLKVKINTAIVPREYPLYVYTQIGGPSDNKIITCATSNLSVVSASAASSGVFDSSSGISNHVPMPSGRPGVLVSGAPTPVLAAGYTNEPGAVVMNKVGNNYRILMGLKNEPIKWVCLNDLDLKDTCGDEDGCKIIYRMLADDEGYDRTRMYVTTLYMEQDWMSRNLYSGKYGYTEYYSALTEWESGNTERPVAYDIVNLWNWLYVETYKHPSCGFTTDANTLYPAYHFGILLNPGIMADIEILDHPN